MQAPTPQAAPPAPENERHDEQPPRGADSLPRSFNELEAWLNQRRVTEIECLVPDLTGVARGKILPRSKFTVDRGMRLPESIIGLTVTGNWPDDEKLSWKSIPSTPTTARATSSTACR